MLIIRKRSLPLLATIILTLNIAAFGASKVFFISEISKEEYRVYAAVFDGVVVKEGILNPSPHLKLLLINDVTIDNRDKLMEGNQYAIKVKKRLPSLLPETINSFAHANQQQARIEDKFTTRLQHILFKESEIKEFFRDGTGYNEYYKWEKFYQKFPNSPGIVGVSRIGFNSAKTQALVYFEHWCQFACGTGNYIVLKKTNGKWKISEWAEMWIS